MNEIQTFEFTINNLKFEPNVAEANVEISSLKKEKKRKDRRRVRRTSKSRVRARPIRKKALGENVSIVVKKGVKR